MRISATKDRRSAYARTPLAPAPPSAPVPVKARGAWDLNWSAIFVVLAALAYNAGLAFLNARGMYIGVAAVIATEVVILAFAALLILGSGRRSIDTPAMLFFGFFLINAIVISLVNEVVFVDMARNAGIISLFLMLGARISERTLKNSFRLAAGIVFGVLLLELLSIESYAAIFAPGAYFEQTRGIEPFELDELGLFRNALGFDDRFFILKITEQRTSSIFLEQVSLANFSTVLVIFVTCMWDKLTRIERALYLGLTVLILVTNNSRTALALALVAPLIYHFAHRLWRSAPLLIMPVILAGATLVALGLPPSVEDDLAGRLNKTIETLTAVNLQALAGGHATLAKIFADSGYAYVIYASSLVGLVCLWLFVSLIVTGSSKNQLRSSIFLGLFVFGNMMIGGTAIFSIKIAALLWLFVGYISRATKVPADDSQRPEAAAEALPSRGTRYQTG